MVGAGRLDGPDLLQVVLGHLRHRTGQLGLRERTRLQPVDRLVGAEVPLELKVAPGQAAYRVDEEHRRPGALGADRQQHLEPEPVFRLADAGQRFNGLVREHVARRQLDARLPGTGDELQRGDAVAAEVEEADVGADAVEAEDVRDDPAELLLLGRARVASGGGLAVVGGGQGAAVELAVRADRERVEPDERGGHHVLGQPVLDELAEAVDRGAIT